MTPKEAQQELEDEDNIVIIESDLDPDDPRKGRAQFLIEPIGDFELPDELDVHNVERSPPQFRHVALPPN